MVERDLIVDSKSQTHDGYVDPVELENLIDQHLRDNGYVKNDISRSETVHSDGRELTIKKEPYKRLTEYAKITLTVELHFEDLKEVMIERDGMKKKLSQGKLKVTIWGWLEMDWEHRWEQKAIYYFIATLVDRFVHKWQADKLKNRVAADTGALYVEIQNALGMYKYK